DVAGTVSSASAALTLTIDMTAPPVPGTPVLAPGSDSGVPGDNLTNATKPAVTGTGTAGDTITLYNGLVAVGSTTLQSGGTWTVAPTTTLSDALHSLTVTETDPAGNASAQSQALSLTIDTIAPATPAAPLLAAGSDSGVAGDGITNIAVPLLVGSGTAG